jgi:pimeloyl-ACP methyl ester carboxylesterase
MKEGQITLADGRTVGYADYGTPDQTAVLWCHGGPGCRYEPDLVAGAAERAGLRLVGVDRPGYGRSTPNPGRTIGGWVQEGFVVADHLGIDRFVSVGVSTGGAYALALASSSDRVMAAVACCAVTDMQWPPGKATMPRAQPVWNARTRDEALAIVTAEFGLDGSETSPAALGDFLAPSDAKMLEDPSVVAIWQRWTREWLAHGAAGYADDRLADGRGWVTFDVGAITCPVVVLHGSADGFVPVVNAHHTAEIVPDATLHVIDGLGHFSVITHVVDAVTAALGRAPLSGAAAR